MWETLPKNGSPALRPQLFPTAFMQSISGLNQTQAPWTCWISGSHNMKNISEIRKNTAYLVSIKSTIDDIYTRGVIAR